MGAGTFEDPNEKKKKKKERDHQLRYSPQRGNRIASTARPLLVQGS